GIDKEILFEALEQALLSASKKTVASADNVRMHLDRHTGQLRAFQRKRVVEQVEDSRLEISLAEAKALNTAAELDDELEQELPPQEFGRIAAQTAKQVILQRVREAEREGIYSEFAGKEGQIVRGVVHRIEKRNVIMEIGKAEAILPEREQIPGERYAPGDRVRAYVIEVKKSIKGPQITLSRTHPGYLIRLFETEIPEVQEGIVLVKAAAREAGERAKVAVASTKRDVDPIGACVGLRGTRIQVISRELRGEKIDIVEWSHDPATFVARALSPAKVSSVTVIDDTPPADAPERRADAPEQRGDAPEQRADAPEQRADASMQMGVLVAVPDNQLSLAIGKRGQNARLAAKLTGMRIDIKSDSELEAERTRSEQELADGRAWLAALPGVAPSLVDQLVAEGLHSPALILRAGRERLSQVGGIDAGKAEKLLAAAEDAVERDREAAEAAPVLEDAPTDVEEPTTRAAGEAASG
ncbi:MAG TPA: transcription termination factor NusA, partial [Candidatus Limnocylindrales bacterium]|nr:transcription termination factor NusA [Candidatus Limnocylindrales bacterium]